MDEKTQAELRGYARAHLKSTAGAYVDFEPEAWPSLRKAWTEMGGGAFFAGKDLFGDVMIIKLADISVIAHGTPEGVQRFLEDERIERQREVLG